MASSAGRHLPANTPMKLLGTSRSTLRSCVTRGPRWKLPKQAPNPFTMDCEPELDKSPELGPDLASFYDPDWGALMDPRAWEGRHCNGSFHAFVA